jgi:hypothetical protein
VKLATVFVTVALIGAACSGARNGGSDQIELQRARAGDIDVVLLSNDGSLSHDKDTFTVEFRRGDDLVDVGTVKAGATMPMAGMAPMMGSVFVERDDVPGRYTAQTDLSMSGGWKLTIEWNGPAGRGMTTFQATVD